MALLDMIQDVTDELGLTQPNSIIGNNDSQVRQFLALANKEGKDLARRFDWEVLTRINTFTLSTSASLQGAINSSIVTDGDFDKILPNTFWNLTTSLPILGGLNARQIQSYNASPITGPYYQYHIRGGKLYIDPTPSAADSASFAYRSSWWCEDSGGNGQAEWAADTDVGRLDEELMKLGLLWRWKAAKGLDYAEDFNTYEARILEASNEGEKPVRSLNGTGARQMAGIVIPVGTWNQ